MQIIYRISDKGRPLDFYGLNKIDCLKNFISEFPIECMTIIADNCNEETRNFLSTLRPKHISYTSEGNSETLKRAFKLAMQSPDETQFYFVEDDFIHLPGSFKLLKEGLNRAEYVTLYDHSDKYMTVGPNPYINGGENTFVFKTDSSHWKYTNSTVQTFATTAGIIKEDREILWKYNFNNETPDSFNTFIELIKTKNRRIASCIPGKATHCMKQWASPLIDWEDFVLKLTRRATYPMWMTDNEKELLFKNITNTDKMLEWGSGGSTFELAKRVAHLTSIEHDAVWFYKIERQIKSLKLENVVYLYVPNDLPRSYPHVKYEEFKTYVNAIDKFAGKWDKILIDGRARIFCAEQVKQRLNPNAKIFIHDWDRPEYHVVLKNYNLLAVADKLAMLEAK